MTRLLVVCTANQCRSPLAGALFAQRLLRVGADVTVESAGLFGGGYPPPPEVDLAGRAFGVDLEGHRSRAVVGDDLQAADLVLGMAREHVRELVVLEPTAWPRTFSLREFVRRAEEAGPRREGQPLSDWLAAVHGERRFADLLGESVDDDVEDPMGGPPEGYSVLAEDLWALSTRAVAHAWPTPTRPA